MPTCKPSTADKDKIKVSVSHLSDLTFTITICLSSKPMQENSTSIAELIDGMSWFKLN